MSETCSLTSVSVQSLWDVAPYINKRENILEMIQGSPQLYTCRSACCINALHMQVCQTVGEADLYPYLDQRVHYLEPRDIAQCMGFCHILVPGIA
jgi:hypothetical protein